MRLQSEIRRDLEDRLKAEVVARAPDIVSAALASLAKEYDAHPLIAEVQKLASDWMREVGLTKCRGYVLQLTRALEAGDFGELPHLDADRRRSLTIKHAQANPEARAEATRWAAWISYEIGSVYKLIGRALLGMEAT